MSKNKFTGSRKEAVKAIGGEAAAQKIRSELASELGGELVPLVSNLNLTETSMLRHIEMAASTEQALKEQTVIGAKTTLEASDFFTLLLQSYAYFTLGSYFLKGLDVQESAEKISTQLTAFNQRLESTHKTLTGLAKEWYEETAKVIPEVIATTVVKDLGDSRLSIVELSEMPLPLNDNDREKIDELFVSYSDEVDVDQAKAIAFLINLFYFGNIWSFPETKRQNTRYNITDETYTLTQKAGERAVAYFSYYLDRCISDQFARDQATSTENILPENTALLPIVLGSIFVLNDFTILPVNFQNLLLYGLVPGLEPEEIAMLATEQRKRFEAKPKVGGKPEKRMDEQGYLPYGLVDSSYASGQTLAYMTRLAEQYQNEPIVLDISGQSALQTFIQYYDRIRLFLEKEPLISTLNDTELSDIAAIDLSVSQADATFIDLLLISKKQELIAFQIDREGRIIGVPEGFEGNIDGLINYISTIVVNKLKTLSLGKKREGYVIPTYSEKPQAQETLSTRRQEQVSPTLTQQQITPSKVIEAPQVTIAKPMKRKTARRLGLIEVLQNETERERDATKRGETYIRIPFATIEHLQEGRQKSVRRAVRQAERELDNKRIPRNMEQLKDIGENAYVLRVGQLRVVIQRNEEEGKVTWQVIDVSKRQENSYGTLKQKLGSRKDRPS